jgi:hypothetical protein
MTMRALALVVSLSLAACSTTSTIHRAYGPAYEAEIVDSDANRLRVLGDDGRIHEVPREEVTDIDHPGNVLFTVGAVLVGVAAIVAFSTPDGSNLSQQQQEHDRETATAVSLVYGVPGLAMLIAGGVPYFSSRSKASAFETGRAPTLSRPPQVRSLPPPAPPRLLAPAPPAPAPAQPAPAPSPPADEPQVIPAPPAEPPR